MRALLFYSLVPACIGVACGTSSPVGAGASDASADGSFDAGETRDAADAAQPPKLSPSPPDPGKVICGASTCDTPAQLCCFSSVAPGGAANHCEVTRAACAAPSVACDETADCAAGEICCTGVAVLPRDAGVSGFEATSCVPKDAPGSCKPVPGVGNSSVQACKTDAECLNGQKCIVQDCFGRALMTCGPDAQCR